MKLLFAIKNMCNAKGGAEKVLSIVINGLVKSGHDVALVTFDSKNSESFYQLSEGVRRIYIDIGDSGAKANLPITLRRMSALRSLLRDEKPDAFIPFMHSMFVPAAFASVGLNIPILASEHIVPQHYKKRKFEYLLLILSSFFVSKITVLSEAVKKTYPALLRNKMIVMPNPVQLNDKYIHEHSNKDNNLILNVGRLTEQKDQETLIKAFSFLSDDFPDWTVRIVGEGEDHEKLDQLIRDLNLNSKVALAGTTKNIEAEYSAATIFALPSKYESFGLATAEAMLCGVPVVGFMNCPGTNEIIRHMKNGLLVKTKECRSKAFSEALRTLIQDKELRTRLGKQGREDSKAYSVDTVVSKWKHSISEVMKINKSPEIYRG